MVGGRSAARIAMASAIYTDLPSDPAAPKQAAIRALVILGAFFFLLTAAAYLYSIAWVRPRPRGW